MPDIVTGPPDPKREVKESPKRVTLEIGSSELSFYSQYRIHQAPGDLLITLDRPGQEMDEGSLEAERSLQYATNVESRIGNAKHTGFENESIDQVVMSNVINGPATDSSLEEYLTKLHLHGRDFELEMGSEWTQDKMQILNESLRIIKPGAKLLFMTITGRVTFLFRFYIMNFLWD